MKKILLLSALLISQFAFTQDDSQSDLEKLLGKAQEVLSNVELPDLNKDNDVVIISLQVEKFGVTYLINNGKTVRAKDEEGDLLIEKYLNQGYKLHSVTHRGGLGVLFTLIK